MVEIRYNHVRFYADNHKIIDKRMVEALKYTDKAGVEKFTTEKVDVGARSRRWLVNPRIGRCAVH